MAFLTDNLVTQPSSKCYNNEQIVPLFMMCMVWPKNRNYIPGDADWCMEKYLNHKEESHKKHKIPEEDIHEHLPMKT